MKCIPKRIFPYLINCFLSDRSCDIDPKIRNLQEIIEFLLKIQLYLKVLESYFSFYFNEKIYSLCPNSSISKKN